jgi:hypothetical protein
MPLTVNHTALLEASAIKPEVARAAGVSSITDPRQLPAGAPDYWAATLPAVLYWWVSVIDGRAVPQLAPDVPRMDAAGKTVKYEFPEGHSAPVSRPIPRPRADTVLIVEGTKQHLAAASYADPLVEVLGISGRDGWMREGVPDPGLTIVDGKHVVIMMDADAATNLDVYRSAENLANECQVSGAVSTKYAWVPGGKKSGIDDYLAAQADDTTRVAKLDRLIRDAKSKPAKNKPLAKPIKHQRAQAGSIEASERRILIDVGGDPLATMDAITTRMLESYDADRVFNLGGVLAWRNGHSTQVLDPHVFYDKLQHVAKTVRTDLDPLTGETANVWGDPSVRVLESSLRRAERYSALNGITRTPFMRSDGSVCQEDGYDKVTGTFLALDPTVTWLEVPATPTREQIDYSRRLLIDDWLGDFAFDDAEARANMLALLLTPLTRSMVDKVPLAVLDGLQPQVGKGMIADLLAIMATGEAASLASLPGVEEERRKQLTSMFLDGRELVFFDEAHVLEGDSLAKALTGAVWSDRVLGASKSVEIPNRMTWVAMGNKVELVRDIAERVYRIYIAPKDGYRPQDRSVTSWRYPDIQAWTRAHRPELVRAGLTLARGWFAAGRPAPREDAKTLGGFGQWARIMHGITDFSGQPGFLSGRKAWSSESDFDHQHWTEHFAWLLGTFGAQEFSAGDVVQAMLRDTLNAATPPGLEDTNAKGYSRTLGARYKRAAARSYGGVTLTARGAHDHKNLYRVSLDDYSGFSSTISNWLLTYSEPPYS